jgi:hypothetical protein
MSTAKYILDGNGQPVREPDLIKWATWFEKADRKIASDKIGETVVSTIFLGADFSYPQNDDAPILWETMAFGPKWAVEDRDRCSGSREQAEAMHARMLEQVKSRKIGN